LPGSLLIPSSLAQGVGRDPGSELEESTPWPSKNPGENTGVLSTGLRMILAISKNKLSEILLIYI